MRGKGLLWFAKFSRFYPYRRWPDTKALCLCLFIGKQSRETQKICILQWNHAITNIYIQTGFHIYCNIILSWVESERNSSFMRILYVWRGSYCIRIHICICTHVCVYTYIYAHTYILISEHVRWAWQQDQHSISSKTTKRNKRNINIMGAEFTKTTIRRIAKETRAN